MLKRHFQQPFLASLFFLVANIAAAQPGPPGLGGGFRGGPEGPNGGMPRLQAMQQRIDDAISKLDLTDEQKKKIADLRSENKKQLEDATKQIEDARKQMEKAMQAARDGMQKNRESSSAALKQVLSEDQFKKFEDSIGRPGPRANRPDEARGPNAEQPARREAAETDAPRRRRPAADVAQEDRPNRPRPERAAASDRPSDDESPRRRGRQGRAMEDRGPDDRRGRQRDLAQMDRARGPRGPQFIDRGPQWNRRGPGGPQFAQGGPGGGRGYQMAQRGPQFAQRGPQGMRRGPGGFGGPGDRFSPQGPPPRMMAGRMGPPDALGPPPSDGPMRGRRPGVSAQPASFQRPKIEEHLGKIEETLQELLKVLKK